MKKYENENVCVYDYDLAQMDLFFNDILEQMQYYNYNVETIFNYEYKCLYVVDDNTSCCILSIDPSYPPLLEWIENNSIEGEMHPDVKEILETVHVKQYQDHLNILVLNNNISEEKKSYYEELCRNMWNEVEEIIENTMEE